MKDFWIVIALLPAGAPAFAQTAAAPSSAPAAPVAAAAAVEKSQLDAYADKERAELHSFVEAAKAQLDQMEKKETIRLEAVAKRAVSEPFADADQAKIRSLQELMTSSSADVRKKALGDLRDKLRTQKAAAIWSKYKTKKKAFWDKLQLDWQKLLTQPPLMIRAKTPAPAARPAKH